MVHRKVESLCPDAKMIRQEVFVDEQGFEEEFDTIDNEAVHLVFYEADMPIATCRYYKGDVEGEYIAGRIAVRKAYRGTHLGNEVMEVMEENILLEGGRKVVVSAQMQAAPFYEKNGYWRKGVTYFDEHCEHIQMEKVLK